MCIFEKIKGEFELTDDSPSLPQIEQDELEVVKEKKISITKEEADISSLINTKQFSQVTARYYVGSNEEPVLGTYTLTELTDLINKAPKRKNKDQEIAILKGIYNGGISGAYCNESCPFIFFDIDVKKETKTKKGENKHLFDRKVNADLFDALSKIAVLTWRSNSQLGIAGIFYVPQIKALNNQDTKEHLLIGKAIGESLKKELNIECFDEAQFRFRQIRYLAHQKAERVLNLKPMAFKYKITEKVKETPQGNPVLKLKNHYPYPGSIEKQFNNQTSIVDALSDCGFKHVKGLRYKHPSTTSDSSGEVNLEQNKFFNFSTSFSKYSYFTPYFLYMFYMYNMNQRAFLKDLRSQGYENIPIKGATAKASDLLKSYSGPREEAIFRACFMLKSMSYQDKLGFVESHSHNQVEDELFYYYLGINNVIIEYDKKLSVDRYVVEQAAQIFDYLDHEKKVVLVADTGVGKTTAILESFKALRPKKRVLFLAPLTVIVDQLEQKYPDIPCLTGESIPDEHSRANIASVVVATYEQGTKHLRADDFDYVVIDEVHQLINSNNFKEDEITALTTKTKSMTTLGLTGTPSQLFSKMGYKLLRVTKKQSESLKIIKRVDNRSPFKIILQHQAEVSKKAIYRLNSKKTINNVYKRLIDSGQFKENEVLILMSERGIKKGEGYKSIANKSMFPGEVKVVLTTSIIDEGVSIDQDGFSDVVFIEKDYFPSPEPLKQFFARFRNHDPERKNYYYIKTPKDHEAKNYNITYEYQERSEQLSKEMKERGEVERLSNKDIANNDYLFYQDSTVNSFQLSNDINKEYFKSISREEYIYFLEENYNLTIETDYSYTYKKIDDSDVRKREREARHIIGHYWLNHKSEVNNAILAFSQDEIMLENGDFMDVEASDEVMDIVSNNLSAFRKMQERYLTLEELGATDIDTLLIDKRTELPYSTQIFNRHKALYVNLKTIKRPETKTDEINKAKMEAFIEDVRRLDSFQGKDLKSIWRKQKAVGGRYSSYNLLDLVLHLLNFSYNSKKSRYYNQG